MFVDIGHFGAGVLSYFRFLKWLFQLNVLIFLLIFSFIVLPEIVFTADDTYSTAVTGTENYSSAVFTAINCSSLYEVNVTDSPIQNIIDFLQGTVRKLIHYTTCPRFKFESCGRNPVGNLTITSH